MKSFRSTASFVVKRYQVARRGRYQEVYRVRIGARKRTGRQALETYGVIVCCADRRRSGGENDRRWLGYVADQDRRPCASSRVDGVFPIWRNHWIQGSSTKGQIRLRREVYECGCHRRRRRSKVTK